MKELTQSKNNNKNSKSVYAIEAQLQRGGRILSKITYPLVIIISRIPTTLTSGIQDLNPKKIMWREQYKQNYPSCVWFFRYPNRLNVKHIGKGSRSGSAIRTLTEIEIYIGDNVRIAPGLNIIDKKLGNPLPIGPSKLYIGNDVFIGPDVKIMVSSGEKLVICDGTRIGTGSIVTTSIRKKGVYSGVPAVLVNKKTQNTATFIEI
jgi:acetyltransferase-like isoleucine patch superfamily enzyme